MGFLRNARQRLRRALLPSRFLTDFEAMRMTQGKILIELNRAKPAQPLSGCEFRVFSQWGEDGIVQRLIDEVPIVNRTFMEFGVEDFTESNCRFLLMNNNWRGYVMDGSSTWVASMRSSSWWWKHDINARCAFITRENVNELLQASGFDRDVGVLSIDVDGVDYWLLEALTVVEPRILIVEYNALFGAERKITVPYDPQFARRQKHYSDLYFGASLGALAHIAAQKGYSLVGTESAGVNAFFVRTDLLGSMRALSTREAFTECMVRQSRNSEGRLDFLGPDERAAVIRGLPVINVETGLEERL